MKILICDDHSVVREGLRQILQSLEGLTLIAQANDGKEALTLLKKEVFDIVLLDISLPDRNGLEILQIIKDKWPATNVLMLSMYSQEMFAMRALSLGASGYLTKGSALEELVIAVKKVSLGQKYISPSLEEILLLNLTKDKVKLQHELLSDREFQIMIEIANGKSSLEIGIELSISNKTVGTYRNRIMKKMGFSKNIEFILYCMKHNLI